MRNAIPLYTDMAKSFDDHHYSGFKIETIQPKRAPKKRRFKLSILFWLLLAWALLLVWTEKTGSLWRFFE
jgi:hypothetical protein